MLTSNEKGVQLPSTNLLLVDDTVVVTHGAEELQEVLNKFVFMNVANLASQSGKRKLLSWQKKYHTVHNCKWNQAPSNDESISFPL